MATFTPNFSLTMPDYAEPADIAVLNGNTSQIDSLIYQGRRMAVGGYDSTATYNTGDLVEYSNALYRCKEDNVTGNWDSTKWDLTTLADEIESKGEGGADVTKEASGNPVEFDDGASAPLVKCVSAITGSQDLHGYDKPWVGGAGKNKLEPYDGSSQGISNTWTDGVLYMSGTASGSPSVAMIGSVNTLKSYIFSCESVGATATVLLRLRIALYKSGNEVYRNTYNFDYGQDYTYDFNEYDFDASIISIVVSNGGVVDGVILKPMIRLATESDSTFAPYSNICPITAYTEGEIEVRGRNIWDEQWEVGSLDASGEPISNTNSIRSKNLTPCQGNEDYYLNYSLSGDEIRICFYDENQTFVSRTGWLYKGSFQTPTTARYMKLLTSTVYGSTYRNDIIVAIGSQAVDYEPYTSTTHTATFSQSIYQGNADFVGGEAECEWKVIDLGDLTWTYASSSSQFRSSRITDIEEPADLTIMPNAICENYETIIYQNISSADSAFTVIFASSNDHGKIYVKDSRYTDATTFTNAVSGVKLAYKLATTATESITPSVVRSLDGYNHIESSTGDLDVEYITKDFQPIVDLIESSGAETQDILYVADALTDTQIDVDMTAYDDYIIYANDVLTTTQIPMGVTFTRAVVDMAISDSVPIVIAGYDDYACVYNVASDKLTYSSGANRIVMIVGIKH